MDEEQPAAPLPARARKRIAAPAAAPPDTAAVDTGMQASEAVDAGMQAGAPPEPPAPEQAPSPSPSPAETDRAATELRARADGAEADLASLRRVLAAERGAAEARQGSLHCFGPILGESHACVGVMFRTQSMLHLQREQMSQSCSLLARRNISYWMFLDLHVRASGHASSRAPGMLVLCERTQITYGLPFYKAEEQCKAEKHKSVCFPMWQKLLCAGALHRGGCACARGGGHRSRGRCRGAAPAGRAGGARRGRGLRSLAPARGAGSQGGRQAGAQHASWLTCVEWPWPVNANALM